MRKRVFVCLLLCLCPIVYLQECMCVWVFSSLLLLIHLWDFAWLPCLILLSQSFFSPGPPIHQFMPRTPPTSGPFPIPRVSGSHIFSPLSTFMLPIFSLLSHISWSQRPLSLYPSSYYVFQPSICTPASLALPDYPFFLPLSLSYLPHTPFPCSLISVRVSGLSLFGIPHICQSIPCLYNYFLASNLFMFSLVLL